MSCYECGRAPGEVRCRYTDGCPRGEFDGPEDWACIPAPRHLEQLLELPRRPGRYGYGPDLPVGTYQVEPLAGGRFTVQRTIGATRWWPLTRRADPAWLTWPSRAEAALWIDAEGEDLCDWSHWGTRGQAER